MCVANVLDNLVNPSLMAWGVCGVRQYYSIDYNYNNDISYHFR